jgi:type IV pilus assembly protein PilB
VLAAQSGVAPWNLSEYAPEPSAVQLLPKDVCEKYQVLPVKLSGDLLKLAMRNPLDFEVIDLARNLTKKRIEPVLADAERLFRAIENSAAYESGSKSMNALVREAVKENGRKSSKREKAVLTEADTRPVVSVVNQILSDAIRLGASDAHIEPRGNRVEIRYRVDGQMRKARDLPLDILPMLTARLKIMSELDIVETRIPQDGRATVEIDGRDVDVRLSFLPNYHGQRTVMRILDRSASLLDIGGLGHSEANLALFRGMIEKPYGMLLVTGPTGSGKTTTLYAALKEIQKTSNNIMTAEDPVEYEIDGISQSQVNEKVGLTFPVLLRSILRQDPDAILVGEIRDRETAQTAIRAALTGHLVLSTLHCNDAPSAIPRLVDMGADPYLLSTSIIGVVAQRLVRMLCPHCRQQNDDPNDAKVIAAALGSGHSRSSWKAKGCAQCANTGYKGRIAVHEVLPVQGPVAGAFAVQTTLDEVRALASAYGYEPLQVDALNKVLQGKTTLDEVRLQVSLKDAGSAPSALRLAA